MKALDDTQTVTDMAARDLDCDDPDQSHGQSQVLARMPDLSETLEDQGSHNAANDAALDQNPVAGQDVSTEADELATAVHGEDIVDETQSATSVQYDSEPLRRFAVPFGGTLLGIAVLALIALALRNRSTPSSPVTSESQWPEIAELEKVPNQTAVEYDGDAEVILNKPTAAPEVGSDLAQSRPNEDSTVLVDHLSPEVAMEPPLAETTDEIPQSHYRRQPPTEEPQLADSADALPDDQSDLDNATRIDEGTNTSTRLSLGGPIAQRPLDSSPGTVQPNPSETYQQPIGQRTNIRDSARPGQGSQAIRATRPDRDLRAVSAPTTPRLRYPSTGFAPQDTSAYEARRDFEEPRQGINGSPDLDTNGYRDSYPTGRRVQDGSRPTDNEYTTPNSTRYHELNR